MKNYNRDLAFLESLNQKLVTELEASHALEKELRERIRVLEFELRTERRATNGLLADLKRVKISAGEPL